MGCEYDIETLTKMLQEALTFDGRFESEEFSRFREGFVRTVNDFALEMGYRDREDMLRRLKDGTPEQMLSEIQAINANLKQKSSQQMPKIVELYYGNGMGDQGLRSFIQVMLQKLRKGIATAENEISCLIAEILYGFVTLATLKI